MRGRSLEQLTHFFRPPTFIFNPPPSKNLDFFLDKIFMQTNHSLYVVNTLINNLSQTQNGTFIADLTILHNSNSYQARQHEFWTQMV